LRIRDASAMAFFRRTPDFAGMGQKPLFREG